MSIAFTFPGQGSQAVGMGRDLAEQFAEARAVFQEVDDALGEKLSDTMWNGPESDLTLTANAQPALMAVSLATMRVIESRGLDLKASVAFVAGHSLGEYSALAAAGALSVADAARLLRIRGDAMQKAVPVGEGAMAALLGADDFEGALRRLQAEPPTSPLEPSHTLFFFACHVLGVTWMLHNLPLRKLASRKLWQLGHRYGRWVRLTVATIIPKLAFDPPHDHFP